MRKQFKSTVMELAARDEKIVVLLGDVSVYLFNDFKTSYPDRFYNLGICESTLISVGAGLSLRGLRPFIHTIAPFITERCYEQIKLDLCYNRLGGNIVSCGSSFDYAWDGATHHSYGDLALMRLLPEMEVFQPGSGKELEVLIKKRYHSGKPAYYRLSDHPHQVDLDVEYGRGVVIKDCGADLTVVTAGPLLANVLEACKDLDVNILYFHTIKPIDSELIQLYSHTTFLIIQESHGLQEAVNQEAGVKSFAHGTPEGFCNCYGTLADVRKNLRLDPGSIKAVAQGLLCK
ncbi:transketolase [Desulfocucumis palustris]|uniref:Transketolase n=1 Tax=Desulfocucumis palustris TaxID=1898651 RepID=A0A2L2XGS9_9FIRM|nr:hypothetical protein [Desulfocucumis palustris]GBF33426.1 transketolase [Desulfocucumis palustris]